MSCLLQAWASAKVYSIQAVYWVVLYAALEVSDRQALVQRVNRDDAQWRWVQSSCQHGVAPVPDWSAMPANAQSNILKALARAVITHRKTVDARSRSRTRVARGTLQAVL